MKLKYSFWTIASLLVIAAIYFLFFGQFPPSSGTVDSGEPTVDPIVRKVHSDTGRQQIPDSGDQQGRRQSSKGVTRTFFKPSDSQSAQTVDLEITAHEQIGALQISGNLRDGLECSRLQIELELQSDDGRKVFHTLVLGKTGGSDGRTIRSKRRLMPAQDESPASWSAHVAAIRCLDP